MHTHIYTHMHTHAHIYTHMHTLTHTDQLLELHRGQGKDIYWRDSMVCPTEEEYIEMVRQSEWWASNGVSGGHLME